MATATKAAQSGTAATEAAVTKVTDTVAATVSKATAVATDIVTRTTDALAPVVKNAEAKTAELAEAFSPRFRARTHHCQHGACASRLPVPPDPHDRTVRGGRRVGHARPRTR